MKCIQNEFQRGYSHRNYRVKTTNPVIVFCELSVRMQFNRIAYFLKYTFRTCAYFQHTRSTSIHIILFYTHTHDVHDSTAVVRRKKYQGFIRALIHVLRSCTAHLTGHVRVWIGFFLHIFYPHTHAHITRVLRKSRMVYQRTIIPVIGIPWQRARVKTSRVA